MVAYYPDLVQLFSLTSGKKVAEIRLEGHSIMGVHSIGLSVFISMYDGGLFVYEGKEVSRCCRYKGEWVRFRYDDAH